MFDISELLDWSERHELEQLSRAPQATVIMQQAVDSTSGFRGGLVAGRRHRRADRGLAELFMKRR
ncbi:MAG TPA: hypothetical protein VF612_01630 [Jatrophihabitans sp.]|jgi:hypothetical protein|uniref:hypothetical protein n=1 Tax=Jatrophihabitans sp. TaxID=1932789 RepID=UPI002F0B2B3A